MSKVSIERITKIVRLIRKRRAAPMAYLMNELEVSQASVKRDLDFLRDRLGCPLEWDPKKRGWVIRDDLAEGVYECTQGIIDLARRAGLRLGRRIANTQASCAALVSQLLPKQLV